MLWMDFGWAALLSLAFTLAGIGFNRYYLVVAGILAAAPLWIYFIGSPRSQWPAFGLLSLHVVAAFATAGQKRWMAALIAAPVMMVMGVATWFFLS